MHRFALATSRISLLDVPTASSFGAILWIYVPGVRFPAFLLEYGVRRPHSDWICLCVHFLWLIGLSDTTQRSGDVANWLYVWHGGLYTKSREMLSRFLF